MKDFFQLMWRKGWKFLLIVALIWILFVIINFFYPGTFSFMRSDKGIPNQNYTSGGIITPKITLRERIYNTFFRNSITNSFRRPYLSGTSTSGVPEGEIDETGKAIINEPIILGNPPTSLNNRSLERLNPDDLYVFPNVRKYAVAQNLRFNNLLVKENGINILSDGTIITGEINSNYLMSYYFNIHIYDEEGLYVYSIPANGFIDPEDKNLLKINAINNAALNMSAYKGDGFMVIWSDNPEVDSILLVKVKID